jgi:hypothetical protein
MTVMMAYPAMPVMRVSNFYDYLCARCGNQRHEEKKG